MSHSCGSPVVNYFSNPAVSYVGRPTGTTEQDNAGVIEENMVRRLARTSTDIRCEHNHLVRREASQRSRIAITYVSGARKKTFTEVLLRLWQLKVAYRIKQIKTRDRRATLMVAPYFSQAPRFRNSLPVPVA